MITRDFRIIQLTNDNLSIKFFIGRLEFLEEKFENYFVLYCTFPILPPIIWSTNEERTIFLNWIKDLFMVHCPSLISYSEKHNNLFSDKMSGLCGTYLTCTTTSTRALIYFILGKILQQFFIEQLLYYQFMCPLYRLSKNTKSCYF